MCNDHCDDVSDGAERALPSNSAPQASCWLPAALDSANRLAYPDVKDLPRADTFQDLQGFGN